MSSITWEFPCTGEKPDVFGTDGRRPTAAEPLRRPSCEGVVFYRAEDALHDGRKGMYESAAHGEHNLSVRKTQ